MQPSSPQSSSGEPPYPQGNPSPEKFGFVTVGVFDARTGDFTQAVQSAAAKLGRPVHFVDDAGYDHEIIAAVEHPDTSWLAWVEYASKDLDDYVDIEFRLKAIIDDKVCIDWSVETYNPYFGCRVGYMAWHGERVVVIYREKHSTYVCSLLMDGTRVRERISDNWSVAGEAVLYGGEQPGQFQRLSIPELKPLDPLPATEANKRELLAQGQMEAAQRTWDIAQATKDGHPLSKCPECKRYTWQIDWRSPMNLLNVPLARLLWEFWVRPTMIRMRCRHCGHRYKGKW